MMEEKGMKKEKELHTFASSLSDRNNIGALEVIGNKYRGSSYRNDTTIKRWLANPYENISNIQELSQSMIRENGILKEFVNYKALILTQDHYIYPSDALKYKDKESLQKDEFKVAEYLERFNVKSFATKVSTEVLRSGEYYIYKRETKQGIVIQTIPSALCRMEYIDGNGIYRYSINVKDITDEELDYFPEEIVKARNRLSNAKNGKEPKGFNKGYYQVSDKGAAFQIGGVINKGLPYYLHLYGTLLDLKKAEELNSINNVIDNYKLVHQKIELGEAGHFLMDSDTMQLFHDALKSVVPQGVGVMTCPNDIKSIPLGDSKLKNTEHINDIKDAIYDNAGIDNSLFNGNSRTNESTVLSSIIDTLVPIKIQALVQSYLNFELQNVCKKGKWKVQFVPTSHYSKHKDVQAERENLTLWSSKKRYMATLGFTPLQAISLLHTEDLLKLEEKMAPLQTSHTISSKDGGRPKNSENPEKVEQGEQGD